MLDRKFILVLCVLCIVSFLPTLRAEELSQPTYDVIEELDMKVTMRDGVRLSTNIYRPDAEGKFPTLLVRTPYGNGGTGDKGACWGRNQLSCARLTADREA